MESSRSMDVEKSSLCNCVVNFLLEENYHLTAFELMHELVEDGHTDQSIRLREFFSDTSLFPPDQISRLNALGVADPQCLLEDKELLEKRLAISDYELRLAQEDILKLKLELQKKLGSIADLSTDMSIDTIEAASLDKQPSRNESSYDLGPLKEIERRDLNYAVKEYLLNAGYKLTAMTFYEEVTDQDLDVWPKSTSYVSNALRYYYYQYISCTDEATKEKMALHQECESLLKENERISSEKSSLQKNLDLVDGQLTLLTKSLEATQKDLKDRDMLVQSLKHASEIQRKDLDDCRSQIASLKLHIEDFHVEKTFNGTDTEQAQPLNTDYYKEETKVLLIDKEKDQIEENVSTNNTITSSLINEGKEKRGRRGRHEAKKSYSNEPFPGVSDIDMTSDVSIHMINPINLEPFKDSCNGKATNGNNSLVQIQESESLIDDNVLVQSLVNPSGLVTSEKMVLEIIQILSEALPKIVPYVLINHREELLPLMMCAIEYHPECAVRDSLTHNLFNLIKRPDEQQRRIIMDACVNLSKKVGEMRTETELLPQCWEQINDKYEERRLLVAQSCSELAEFVQPEIRDSLILSIVQQLIDDSAMVVREAAAHNLALLLPLFPSLDKYFKVEELLFKLVCDPSGSVVESAIRELLPAVIKWGNKLDHILRVLRSHILGSAQRCPPVSGVEGSVDSHLRVLGERERWNINVLLRMLTHLLPFVYQNAIETCPFSSSEFPFTSNINSEPLSPFFSTTLLELYARGHLEWPAFDWMHVDCFPDLIQLSCLLPTKEDNLRNQITKFLLDVSACYGDDYHTNIMLPVLLLAVGDDANLQYIPSTTQSRIKGLRPKTVVAERLAIMCVLPLLLAGILGAPNKKEQLTEFLRNLLLQKSLNKVSWSAYHPADLIYAVRFLSMQQEHHEIIFNILWEMVVSSNLDLKIFAANLLKVLVSYTDGKVASTHILPALVTLGSDQNLNVKYASIDAFGSVAQHFKNDMIVDKICIQMDVFLEDGSHEATVSVVRALTAAVPHTIDRLRDYLLSKIFQLSSLPTHGNNVLLHRERANVFCEAIRSLDATDLPITSIRDFLLPAVQNLLKEADALDPVHKEALEVIIKERSAGTLGAISKVMGTHLGIASSVTSFFGESGTRAKKESEDLSEPAAPPIHPHPVPPAQQDDTRFRSMIRSNFGGMFKRQTDQEQ